LDRSRITALNRKLLRDVLRLRGQAFTIALVLGCGVLAMLMMNSTAYSVRQAMQTYYDEYRFADVFVRLERAPELEGQALREIDGVIAVQTRVVEDVMVPLAGEVEPLVGRIVSLPQDGDPALNAVHLTRGRMPSPSARDEVVILEQFAQAHALSLGNHLPVVLSGNKRDLEVVGIGMSPEYVLATAGDSGPADKRRFVVIWMPRRTLAAAARMEGAFNDASLRVQPGASTRHILHEVDRILKEYGAFPAFERERQTSHQALIAELGHLGSLAVSIPLAFLGVAAFLVNVVISRLVFLERMEIAVLKALGYPNWRVAVHYLGLVSLVVVLGGALGYVTGKWAGTWMTGVYMDVFQFPVGTNQMPVGSVLGALGIALCAALLGALAAALRVARLPPAQAMQPPTPLRYAHSALSSKRLEKSLGTASLMIVREVTRRPLRFAMSSAGIAMGIAIFILGRFTWDSFDYLFAEVFPRQNRGDILVTFTQPRPERAVREIAALPGVVMAEGYRALPVRLRNGHREKDTVVNALPHPTELRQVLHRDRDVVTLPERGLVMTDRLANLLDLRLGDEVEAEVHEGDWSTHHLVVVGLIDESFGVQAYGRASWIHEVLDQERRINSVAVRLDAARAEELHARLKDMPFVYSTTRFARIVENFERQTGDTLGVITLLLAVSAAAISTGVVYNNASVALSLRSRELASLRVLGFTRAEVSAILLGELALQVMVGIPFGMLLGRWWAALQASTFDQETLRFPVHISPDTYGLAGVIALGAGVISALLVRRKLDRLDLIAVLKSRE